MDGWEPATITEYEYDGVGRMVRSTTRAEPEFDLDDVADLLEHKRLLRDTGSWGESVAEATSEQADPQYTGADFVRYVAGYRVNEADAAVEHLKKKTKDLPLGARFYVRRFTADDAESFSAFVEEVDVSAGGGDDAGEGEQHEPGGDQPVD